MRRSNGFGTSILGRAMVAPFFILASGTPAHAEGDAEAGRSVFNRCRACHEALREVNKMGPHLVGLVGRRAGSAAGYSYSVAMREAGAKGLVWDDANLAAYLKDPKEFVIDNRMVFAGVRDEGDLANLIAWLKADPKP